MNRHPLQRGRHASEKQIMRRLINGIFHRFGYEISRPNFAPDLTQEQHDVISAVRPYTLTSVERMIALSNAITHIAKNNVPGDIVECGVWRGGSMMLTALTLISHRDTHRTLHLYDTFEGMSPPTNVDIDFDGRTAQSQLDNDPGMTGVGCKAGIDEVRANLERTNYPTGNIRFIKGRVEDTIPQQAPESIAVLRLDTDWYESTRHELEHLYPRLSVGGFLIVDDYGHWKGSRKAVDEYFANRNEQPYLHRIDYTGRIMIKAYK